MPSYLVTGASRGIGVSRIDRRTHIRRLENREAETNLNQFELLRQISEDHNNVVVGLVRDKASTDKKVAAELNRPNIHIVQGDLTDYDSLKVGKKQRNMQIFCF